MIPFLRPALTASALAVGVAALYAGLPRAVASVVYQLSGDPADWVELAKTAPLLVITVLVLWYCKGLVTEIKDMKKADDLRADALLKVNQEILSAIRGLDERLSLAPKLDELLHAVAGIAGAGK